MSMAFGKPIDPREVTVKAHPAVYPKRAFLAPSITDTEARFQGEMDQAAYEAAKEVTGGTT